MIYKNKTDLIAKTVRGSDVVLDVGFLGQGIREDDPHWPHAMLRKTAGKVYGVDLKLADAYKNNPYYQESSAENFAFPVTFNVIFAGDLIEHLSNPGLFLQCCKRHLKPDGKLILTTPNAFNLFNIAEKFTKREPTTNSDHTFYFNSKVLRTLLRKNGMDAAEVSFLYTLECPHRESFKKKALNALYWLLSTRTDKFVETLVVVAR